ncbi:SapC family protein [Pseudocolwellia sp. HL-MZ7]|uniref:SapC family protein n=1 Tax=Pseudocolwellia sp. HL-MZ7 TaxID=3400627 RepID=UPI003CF1C31D
MLFFDEDGKDTDFYKSAQESLGRLYESEVMTDKFIKELEANDLLLELELSITYNNNQNKKLVGLFGINESKLTELSDEKVIDFHKRGLFIPIHAMLGSAAQINRLAQLRNQSNSKQKVSGIRFTPVTAEEKK